jgi:hypothetical protein
MQAARDVNVYSSGVTAEQAREISLEVYRANAIELTGVAAREAAARAEQLIETFLAKLQADKPEGMQSIAQPDMQWTLYRAQREFARSGEEELQNVLVDLLVDRAGQEDRTLEAIVLNEAIGAVSKLTDAQRRAIAVCFVCQYSSRLARPESLDAFYEHIQRDIVPLATGLPWGAFSYQHIEYVGAGGVSSTRVSFVEAFASSHEGWFTRGFTAADVPTEFRSKFVLEDPNLLTRCFRDASRLQLSTLQTQDVEGYCAQPGFDDALEPMQRLHAMGAMDIAEIEEDLLSRCPELDQLKRAWEGSDLGRLTLTTVGMAVGHAYWRRASGATMSFETFVSEY